MSPINELDLNFVSKQIFVKYDQKVWSLSRSHIHTHTHPHISLSVSRRKLDHEINTSLNLIIEVYTTDLRAPPKPYFT